VDKKRQSALISIISIAGLALSSLGVNAPKVSASPDVFANPEQVRYEGNGGLILPPSVNTNTRNEVIRCRGCGWKLTVACVPGPDVYCDAGIRACPGLIDHMRVWFRPPGGEWKEVDRICLTNYEVTTVTDLETRIAEEFERYVPDQAARCWPLQGAVTNLPLICQSGQSQSTVSWRIPIAGSHVTITTAPAWIWDFEGVKFASGQSGGPYPNTEISHTFFKAGSKVINVTTRWRGNFNVDSLETVPIERDLLQRSTLGVSIGQAKARLRCPGARLC
jgi:hypothetical protein